jgi:hypothetical protein
MMSLCFRCGELLVFDARLKLRRPNQAELTDYQRSAVWPLIERVRVAQRKMLDAIEDGELPPFGA